MCYELSADVKQALELLYYNMISGNTNGDKGKVLLERAMERGDKDAPYFLACCYGGDDFIWSGHKFVPDTRVYQKYNLLAIERGCSIACIAGMNMQGFGDLSTIQLSGHLMAVEEMAKNGEAFCQYVLGRMHYLGHDTVFLTDKQKSDEVVMGQFVVDGLKKSVDYLKASFENGMSLAGTILYNLYKNGVRNYYTAKTLSDAENIHKMGAELGYCDHQCFWGIYLTKKGEEDEAFAWFKHAEMKKEPKVYVHIGTYYHKVHPDYPKAVEYYLRGIKENNDIRAKELYGEMVCDDYEIDDIERDYDQAIKWLEEAEEAGSDRGVPTLAILLINGKAKYQNPPKAKRLLDVYVGCHSGNCKTDYAYGLMLTRGLCVPRDISEGMEYLRASHHPLAGLEMARYKENIFGVWVEKKDKRIDKQDKKVGVLQKIKGKNAKASNEQKAN